MLRVVATNRFHTTAALYSYSGPPPGAVIKALHVASKTYALNEYTSEEMTEIFQQDVDGQPLENKKLLNRRNWCEVRERVPEEQLKFTLRVENLDHVGTQKYPIVVDSLKLPREE